MAGIFWIYSLLVSSAWISLCITNGLQSTNGPTTVATPMASTCSDAEVYLRQDWDVFTSCCELLYPNGTCPIACPCRNGAGCFENNQTCVCKPGWVGSRCQRSCRDKRENTYGLGCKRWCRCGPDASCDPVTGVCQCRDNESNCTSRCPRNRYGPKCRKKCRCKIGGCDHVTGTCKEIDVSQPNCGCLHGGSCEQDGTSCRCTSAWTGRLCDVPCPPGFYGEFCSIACGCGENSTCDRATGICECAADPKYPCPGRCPDGLYGPRCSFVCNCPAGLTCHQLTGDCACPGNDNCLDSLLGKTTELRKEPSLTQVSTEPAHIAGNASISGPTHTSPPPTPPHTGRNTPVIGSGPTTRPAAVKRGNGPAMPDGGDASPQPDSTGGGAAQAGNGFYPTVAFWGVVGTIAALLTVVVILLLLILRRQVSNSRSALTRQPKVGRQDNVYETVEELGKNPTPETEAAWTPPPLPNMFQRGGNARSSLHSYHHRPLSVHSPLPAMDAPLPASVAAMVCNYSGDTPTMPGGTSRRSLMAEWRPHRDIQQQDSLTESRSKSRSQSNLAHQDEPSAQPPTVGGRGGKALSCIYNGITIEDDYADPFDSVSPRPVSEVDNRPPGYLPKLYGLERGRGSLQRSGSPVPLHQPASPMAVQRSDSPMTVQRCESPLAVQRSSSPMNFQRSGSPMTVRQSKSSIDLRQSELNMNVQPSNSPLRRIVDGSSPSSSPRRSSGSPKNDDPVYFTLEQRANGRHSAFILGPEDDYDEMEPQPHINSPSPGILYAEPRPATARTDSDRSRSSSSRASSRGSMSPSVGSPSPHDVDMFVVLDRRPEPGRPNQQQPQQRPQSSNVYESCGPRPMSPPVPLDDNGLYSKLNRKPAQRSELPLSPPRGTADFDGGNYGRLQRSYSAKTPARSSTETYDGPYGKLPARSRSAMVRSQQVSGAGTAECEASEWVPALPRPRLPPRGTKSPVVTEPRKKFRWSIKGKRQPVKKQASEEMEYDCPTSSATLPHPVDWKGL